MKRHVLCVALFCLILQSPAEAFRFFGERRAPALTTALRWSPERFQKPVQKANQYHQQLKQTFPDVSPCRDTERIIDRITGRIPNYKQYDFTTFRINQDEVNAFCTGGLRIYLFKGLLDKAPSRDALAFVIAHEVGHTIAGHIDRQAVINVKHKLTFGLAGNYVKEGLSTLLNAGYGYANGRFSRNHEREADVLGAWYAYKAGYDPVGGIDFFNKLYEMYGDDAGLGKLFGSHPTLKERMARIKQVIGWLKGEASWNSLGQEVKYILRALQDFPGENPKPAAGEEKEAKPETMSSPAPDETLL